MVLFCVKRNVQAEPVKGMAVKDSGEQRKEWYTPCRSSGIILRCSFQPLILHTTSPKGFLQSQLLPKVVTGNPSRQQFGLGDCRQVEPKSQVFT